MKASAAWMHEEAERRGKKAQQVLRQAAHGMAREAKQVAAGTDQEQCQRAEISEAFCAKLAEVWPDDPRVTALINAQSMEG